MKHPILSVVDYEAWERGYMPPSEHRLIDELAYRNAKVCNMSDVGDFAFWIVTRGFSPSGEQSLKLHELMADMVIDEIKKKKDAETNGPVAQLVEPVAHNNHDAGSTPAGPTNPPKSESTS